VLLYITNHRHISAYSATFIRVS